MTRSALLACIVKEVTLLRRDLHGLALLFLMPLVFILVMSLALQGALAAHGGSVVRVLWSDADGSAASRALRDDLAGNEAFALREVAPAAAGSLGGYAVLVQVRAGYGVAVGDFAQSGAPSPVRITVAADTDKRTEQLLVAAINEAIGVQRVAAIFTRLGVPATATPLAAPQVEVVYEYAGASGAAPTAVQQSVPAWLVFAMFFVAIPFSNTFIRERNAGTQARLRAANVGAATQMLGKLVPYFVVTQLQAGLMLLVGVFAVPLLGGEGLLLHGSAAALVLLSVAVGFAALGLALLIAVAAQTTEQATLLAGLGNIVLAAIGGIMVPKFVMPVTMQDLAGLSPMAWGLDGFLDLLLRDGGIGDIAPALIKLFAFGGAASAVAWLRYRTRD